MQNESETQNAPAGRSACSVPHWQDPERQHQVNGRLKGGDLRQMSEQPAVSAYFGLWLFLVYLIVATCGCRTYTYVSYRPDGTRSELWINTCLSDAALGNLTLMIDSNKVLQVEGYSQQVNDEAVKAISEGVTSAVIQAIKPTP